MAKKLGKIGDYEKYLERSTYWKNMYKEDEVSLTRKDAVSVLITHRSPSSTKQTQASPASFRPSTSTALGDTKIPSSAALFTTQVFAPPLLTPPPDTKKPLQFTSCYLNADGHETYEGSSWLYTLYVPQVRRPPPPPNTRAHPPHPQDMATLITTLGGPATFTARVQYLHSTYNLLYIGDEQVSPPTSLPYPFRHAPSLPRPIPPLAHAPHNQAFLTLYLPHYSGRPTLSARNAHAYIPSQFNASVVGIPGNDDSGAMASFSTLSMLGLWPVAGQDVYLLIPPFFREVNITSPITGRTATIRSVGFDPAYRRVAVQSATLDGEVWTRSWVQHRFFLEGGVLEFVLGEGESGWGAGEGDLPPSASTGG